MKRWTTKPLGEVAEFINGRAFKPSDWSSRGVPIIRIQNLTNPTAFTNRFEGAFDERHAVKDDDLLVSWSATLDVFVWNRGAAVLNQHIFRAIPDSSQVSKTYLFYALKSVMDELRSKTHGATMKHLTKGPFERTLIPVPPLAEQRRIMKLLDEADELRKLRAQADRRTAVLIPALFHEMFGESTANQKRWPVRTLGELLVDGPQNGLYKHSSFYGDGFPILRIDAFYDGEVEDLTMFKRLRATPEEVERYGLRKHDIVINRVNSPEYLGKSALIPALLEPTVFESNMMRFTVSTKLLEPGYLIQFLQTLGAKRHILSRAKHSINQSSINQEDVKCLPVPLPPLALQKEFASRVSEIHAMQAEQATSRRRLDDLFQSLLHRAFKGEL